MGSAPAPEQGRRGGRLASGGFGGRDGGGGRGIRTGDLGDARPRRRVCSYCRVGVVRGAGRRGYVGAAFAELGGDSVAALRVCQAIAVSLADDDASPAGTMRGRAGGTFGEALVGAPRPRGSSSDRGGNLSLAAHVAALRSAAIAGELGERAAELARGDLDDDDASVATKRAGDGDEASAPEVDERTEEGASLLRRAAFEGDAVVVEQLVDAGVHVEGAVGVPSRVTSSTPLHVACGGGSRDRDGRAAAALLSRGRESSGEEPTGSDGVYRRRRRGGAKLAAGADPRARRRRGRGGRRRSDGAARRREGRSARERRRRRRRRRGRSAFADYDAKKRAKR